MYKNFLSILTGVIILFISSCNNKSSSDSGHDSKPDTAHILAYYFSPDSTEHTEFVFRITKEEFRFAFKDSTSSSLNFAKKWVIDTTYYVPVLDTLRDSIGKAKFDNNGKIQTGITYKGPYPNQFILVDGIKNIDTLRKKYHLHPPHPVLK